MADVTEAPTQDAIAESLLGPTTEERSVEEQPVAEQQVETEVAEQPVEQDAAEPQETDENWLPTDQDKVFPDDVYARYAQRYNLNEEQAADPLLRQLLHDKINSDIYLQQLRQQEQEFPEEETEAAPEPTQQAPQLNREQYFNNLQTMVQQRTDPEVAKAFHADFLKAFGVPDADIAKVPPQQAMQFTQVASKYMLNLVNTFLDDMLGPRLTQQISQAFPGFGEMYERSAYAMAWDRARGSDPAFANLPAYGTKEFSSKLREAAARIPGFEEMQFTGKDGKPLSMMENSTRKYAMLAKMMSGQNVDPALLQRAAAAGAKNARRAEVRRSAGNLGSGQSKAASGGAKSSGFQTNADIFDAETMENWTREHGRL